MITKFTRRGRLFIAAGALVLALSGCQSPDAPALGRARDLEGRLLGWQNWRPISAEEAKIQLAGDQSLVRRREAVRLSSRFQERWTLDGGHLFYEVLREGGFAAADAEPAFLARLYGNSKGLNERGVHLEAEQVRRKGQLLLATPTSPSHACVVFALFLGERRFEGSPGDRLLRGGLCANQALPEAAAIDMQLIDLLGRLSIDDAPVLAIGGRRADGLLEPDRLAPRFTQQLALAHDGAAADDRRHRPADDLHALERGPAAFAQH